MFGTSMATPYISGAIGLWRQHRARVWGSEPPGGWTAAALRDFKVTAKAVPLPGSAGLMWPAARVGAGARRLASASSSSASASCWQRRPSAPCFCHAPLPGIVQVYNAIVNPVTVEPWELKLPSALAVHVINLTLTNASPHAISFMLQHAPAATISLAGAWGSHGSSSHFLDASAPTAAVTLEPAAITVPGQGTAQVSSKAALLHCRCQLTRQSRHACTQCR